MFDPFFIGKVDRKDVRVLASFGSRGQQMLKVVIRLNDNYHVLILKPSLEGYRDQIVIDRLKHVFNLTPMHAFGLELDFVYCNNVLVDVQRMEYVAFASKMKEETETVADQLTLTMEQKEEILMILMFRYIVGALNTSGEHILIKEGKLISISEGRFGLDGTCSEFASQFKDIGHAVWDKSRKRLLKGVLLDNIRGIALQGENPTSSIDRKASAGPLSISVRRVLTNIEIRLDILSTATIDELMDHIGVL